MSRKNPATLTTHQPNARPWPRSRPRSIDKGEIYGRVTHDAPHQREIPHHDRRVEQDFITGVQEGRRIDAQSAGRVMQATLPKPRQGIADLARSQMALAVQIARPQQRGIAVVENPRRLAKIRLECISAIAQRHVAAGGQIRSRSIPLAAIPALRPSPCPRPRDKRHRGRIA